MATEYRKFDIYYLGNNFSSAPPSFSQGTKVDTYIMAIPDQSNITNTNNLVTWSTTAIPTLTSAGDIYNNDLPFTKREIMGISASTYSGYTRLENAFNNLSKRVCNFMDYATIYTDNRNNWFAISNGSVYIAFSVKWHATYISSQYAQGYMVPLFSENYPLRYCSNDNYVVSSTTPAARNCLSIFGFYVSSSSYMLFDYNHIVKISGTYYRYRFMGGYPTYNNAGSITFQYRERVTLTSQEIAFITNATPYTPPPYQDGGTSTTGGGTGNLDNTGDIISVPQVPTYAASNTGFITLFKPTESELVNLARYMWTNPLFDLSAWKKIFADPMQAILGLSIVPLNLPSGTTQSVVVGNIDTGITMATIAQQYVSVDCGQITVNEYWGAYLDYDPYTKIEIYLPYIGTHSLSCDDVMGKTVKVIYHIDVLSGACCAYVVCGGTTIYQFTGQCASSIPITGNDWTNVINGTLNIAKAVGSMIATGGASAPMAIGEIASSAVNQMKPSIEKSGSCAGTGGMMGVQIPYLIITRPRQSLPVDQNTYMGYPSNITAQLNTLTGYTELESVHIENIPATDIELSEIENLLKSGVFL